MQGFHNLESIIKVRADTVFLPLTWMPSSSLCRVSIASQCPRCERTLKGHLPCNPTGSVSITKERLVRNPQSWGPPQSYWLSFCILTGSPGDSYEHWRWNCATPSVTLLSLSKTCTMEWIDWSPAANFGSFIVYPVWVIEKKEEIHSFKEVSNSLTKPATSIRSRTYSWKHCCPVSCCSVMLTLCDTLDCSPLGFSVHGIFHARILEWVAIIILQGSSWPRLNLSLLCLLHCRGFLYHWTIWEALQIGSKEREAESGVRFKYQTLIK